MTILCPGALWRKKNIKMCNESGTVWHLEFKVAVNKNQMSKSEKTKTNKQKPCVCATATKKHKGRQWLQDQVESQA